MLPYYMMVVLCLLFGSIAQANDYRYILDEAGNPCIKIADTFSGDMVQHTATTKLFFGVLSFVLISVAGLRFLVGTDYLSYYWGFERFAGSFWTSLLSLDEPGYRLVCYFISLFTKDPAVSIYAASFITIGLCTHTIYTNTDRLLVAALLYLFVGCWISSLNGIRQCMAGAIVFSGLKYLKSNSRVRFILVVFVAFLFHKSAILMAAVIFFINNKISAKNIFLLSTITVVVLLTYERLFPFVEIIVDTDLSSGRAYLTKGVNAARTLVAVVPAVFFLFVGRGKFNNPQVRQYMNLIILHAVVMLMASNSAYLARFGIYTALFLPISISEMLKTIKPSNRKIVTAMLILLYFLYWSYQIAVSSQLRYFHWIWER